MRAVLVTGATTRLGLELVERLLADSAIGHVVALGVEPRGLGLPLESDRLTYLRVDLTRSREVRRALFGPIRRLGVQALIHTAQHRSALDSGPGVRALNVEATRLLLDLAEEHPTLEAFVLRSYAEVYRVTADQPDVLREDHELNFDPQASQWVRDRVEADLTTCARVGSSRLRILVLRCAEILAPELGSQLHDYLSSSLCLTPLGFDPMTNLLSVADAARALHLALRSEAQGVVNIPGGDTLSLSRAIRLWGRRKVPLPGPLLGPLYRLRRAVRGHAFDYGDSFFRFHFTGLLDGERARAVLGYTPAVPIDWPCLPLQR